MVRVPDGWQVVTPYLLYEDLEGTSEWLCRVFGFTERTRMTDDEGRANHIELESNGGIVMMGTPSADYRNPDHLGGVTQFNYVYVDDVDAHHARALGAGAKIVRELTDESYGDRNYGAQDPEGHQWWFAQHLGESQKS